MPSHEKHVEAMDLEMSATSSVVKEADIIQAQQPLNAQDQQEEKTLGQEEHVKTELPFSKARAIALVITVTAASFMNVCARITHRVGWIAD